MHHASPERDAWSSRIGFVLAAAGSAIGLGNIWRFPYVTGQNGGAAFVVLYIAFVLLIGTPVMVAEIAVGRHARLNPVGAFRKIAPKSLWYMVGFLGVATGIGILSYYSVIAGWTFGYFIKTVSGTFSSSITSDQSVIVFTNFVSNPIQAIFFLFVFIGLTTLVVMGGVSSGIERWVKILMPILFALLLILTIRSVTLNGAVKGLEFYLKPDFTKIHGSTVAMALGQALFSLSLGMGAMITYGSYISKQDNLVISAAWVCFFDTMIAIVAGFLIFPALFAMGLDPAGGPGLVFVVLPTMFADMPLGAFFGAGFFLLLTVAALTSTISLLEVTVAYMVDEKKWHRKSAALFMASLAFILGIPSALSFGGVDWLSKIPGIGLGFLDLMNISLGNYSLTIGAFLISVFVGYKWGIHAVRSEIEEYGNIFFFRKIWTFLIRFICPVAIFAIFVYIVVTKNYF
ncbi:sodium-dependent transporter [candidate division KSB1 bacterium]|nr:sodium-dependent transporter [candidate division KSB1 bacterium]RQV99965.1 MAG: sodium-dependent transporter [candidate division KSB1 bacterium]